MDLRSGAAIFTRGPFKVFVYCNVAIMMAVREEKLIITSKIRFYMNDFEVDDWFWVLFWGYFQKAFIGSFWGLFSAMSAISSML